MKFKPMVGPGKDWSFRDPDTQFLYSATTKTELIERIVAYRAQNELEPLEYLEATIDNYLCGLPQNKGMCDKFEVKRGIGQYVKGGIALVKDFFVGKHVNQKEADRRSKICKNCPLNVFPQDKGMFMSWSDSVAASHIGRDKKSEYHSSLGNCGACTCLLKAKVWVQPPYKLSNKELTQIRKEKKDCWQLPENVDQMIKSIEDK